MTIEAIKNRLNTLLQPLDGGENWNEQVESFATSLAVTIEEEAQENISPEAIEAIMDESYKDFEGSTWGELAEHFKKALSDRMQIPPSSGAHKYTYGGSDVRYNHIVFCEHCGFIAFDGNSIDEGLKQSAAKAPCPLAPPSQQEKSK